MTGSPPNATPSPIDKPSNKEDVSFPPTPKQGEVMLAKGVGGSKGEEEEESHVNV